MCRWSRLIFHQMNSFKVIACLADEDERSRRFLHKCSYEKVTRLCQDVMVSAHKERLHAVCHEMIQTFQKHGKLLLSVIFLS